MAGAGGVARSRSAFDKTFGRPALSVRGARDKQLPTVCFFGAARKR